MGDKNIERVEDKSIKLFAYLSIFLGGVLLLFIKEDNKIIVSNVMNNTSTVLSTRIDKTTSLDLFIIIFGMIIIFYSLLSLKTFLDNYTSNEKLEKKTENLREASKYSFITLILVIVFLVTMLGYTEVSKLKLLIKALNIVAWATVGIILIKYVKYSLKTRKQGTCLMQIWRFFQGVIAPIVGTMYSVLFIFFDLVWLERPWMAITDIILLLLVYIGIIMNMDSILKVKLFKPKKKPKSK